MFTFYNGGKKAQTAVEYTLLLVIILGAFLGITIYFKRGIQGRWKANVDGLGDQYDPRAADTNIRHVLLTNTTTTLDVVPVAGGVITFRTDKTSTEEKKQGVMKVGPYNN